MSDNNTFLAQLQSGIAAKKAQLSQTAVTQLKENWRSYQSNLESIYGMLLQKGVLKEDPYKRDHHVAEIIAPKDEGFDEANPVDELSIRLSEFTSLLDYINDYSSFNIETLTLKQIKAYHDTLKYIHFKEFTASSAKPTTRAFATVVDKLKKSNDQLSAGAAQSSINQLSTIVKNIEGNLKELTKIVREDYKLKVREEILMQMDIGSPVPENIFESEIKKQFQRLKPAFAFYPELIREIYHESYSGEENGLEQKLIESVTPKSKASSIQSTSADLKPLLIEALRILATSTRHIDTALDRMQSNSLVIENKPKTFMEKFKEWIVSMAGGKDEPLQYEVEFIDPTTSTHTTQNIDFNVFISTARRKSKSLNGLLAKGSTLYTKISNADEEQLYGFLDKTSREISQINRTLDGLDTFFKTEVTRFEREKIRGVKNEVAAIKGNLHNANQKKHEYVARKEERDQLKRLGIQ